MNRDEEELFGELEQVFGQVNEDDIENLQEVPLEELISRLDALDDWLKDNGQVIALNPKTQDARDVHGERAAIKIELSRRGY